MPPRKKFDPKEAVAHLKAIYKQYLAEGGDPNRFTIRHYNRINTSSSMYIDVFVKKLGGWNASLEKAGIPLGFRQYREYSKEEVANYVKKVYKLYLAQDKKPNFEIRYKNQEKTFRMIDFMTTNDKAGAKFSLAVILKRFGSWSNILRELDIPIGRSRGLSQEQIIDHVMEVYKRFREKEGEERIFSKEMYEKYNFIDEVYISSKLVERRFKTWMGAKRKMKVY